MFEILSKTILDDNLPDEILLEITSNMDISTLRDFSRRPYIHRITKYEDGIASHMEQYIYPRKM